MKKIMSVDDAYILLGWYPEDRFYNTDLSHWWQIQEWMRENGYCLIKGCIYQEEKED